MQDQSKEMHKVDAELFFVIDEKHNSIELTEKGIELITETGDDKNFFILPDINIEINSIEKSGYLQEEIQIMIKPEKLREFDIPFNTVMKEVKNSHVRQPAGTAACTETNNHCLLRVRVQNCSHQGSHNLGGGIALGVSVGLAVYHESDTIVVAHGHTALHSLFFPEDGCTMVGGNLKITKRKK